MPDDAGHALLHRLDMLTAHTFARTTLNAAHAAREPSGTAERTAESCELRRSKYEE